MRANPRPSHTICHPDRAQLSSGAQRRIHLHRRRSDELNQSYVSPGIHYLVTPDLEVGVRVGWGLGGDAANFFSNVGVRY